MFWKPDFHNRAAVQDRTSNFHTFDLGNNPPFASYHILNLYAFLVACNSIVLHIFGKVIFLAQSSQSSADCDPRVLCFDANTNADWEASRATHHHQLMRNVNGRCFDMHYHIFIILKHKTSIFRRSPCTISSSIFLCLILRVFCTCPFVLIIQ